MSEWSNSVYWREGLFLRPHHLQLSDRYQETRTDDLLRSINRHAWGVIRLELDQDALENMAVEFNKCELILPGGTLFRYPGGGRLERREFKNLIQPGEPLGVYVGVRRHGSKQANVAAGQTSQGAPRTNPKLVEIPDQNTGENTVQVETLELQGSILFSTEKPELGIFEAVKVMEILSTGRKDPPYAVSQDYFPPALRISSFPYLHDFCSRLLDLVTARAKVIAEEQSNRALIESTYRKQGGAGTSLFFALCSAIPELSVMVQDGGVHPYEFYLNLCRFYGGLCAFSMAETPWDVPNYDHENLFSSFLPLSEKIRNLLDVSVPTFYDMATLVFDGDFFCIDLDASWLAPENSFVLAVGGGLSEEEARDLVVNQAKISSRSQMESLIFRALPGVPVTHLSEPPGEIPKQLDRQYFRMDSGDPHWEDVRKSGNLCVYADISPQRITFEVYVILSGKHVAKRGNPR